jgi:hypothetical protein
VADPVCLSVEITALPVHLGDCIKGAAALPLASSDIFIFASRVWFASMVCIDKFYRLYMKIKNTFRE